MELRKAENADLPAIGGLYRAARAAMKAAGIDQWQKGDYPNEADAKKDMDQGRCYVLTQGGQVIAVACLAFGHEPTYDADQGALEDKTHLKAPGEPPRDLSARRALFAGALCHGNRLSGPSSRTRRR